MSVINKVRQDPSKVKEFPFRSGTLKIDFNLVTVAMAEKMNDLLGKVRSKESPVIEFPIDVGETEEDWRDRHGEDLERYLNRDKIRRDYESNEDFAVRVNQDKLKSIKYAPEILNGLAGLFGQAPVSEEDFKAANWPKLRDWIFQVFKEAGVPADEYDPKS